MLNTTPGEDMRRHQIDQLIIKSYLLSTRAENLQDSLPEEKKFLDFEKTTGNSIWRGWRLIW